MRKWLKCKISTRIIGSTVSYYWKLLSCELCKQNLPYSVIADGRINDLVEVNKPSTNPYVILEIKSKDIDRTNSLHVVSVLDTEDIYIVTQRQGRGYESEVRVPDISVSRRNSKIRLVNDDFFLIDNNSKYGTLVCAKRPIELGSGMKISVQVLRSVFMFSVKVPWSFCCCFSRNYWKSYQVQFREEDSNFIDEIIQSRLEGSAFSITGVQRGWDDLSEGERQAIEEELGPS